MADVALKFVVETLVPLITENWTLIVGDANDECARLVEELNQLSAFLQDAAKYRKSNSELWKHFVKEVQVIVYKAEGLIDKLLVQKRLHQQKNVLMKNVDFKYSISVRGLVLSIKEVLQKVKTIREQNPQAFQATPIVDQPEVVAPGPQSSSLEDNEVVGFDEEAKTVIERLDEGTTDLDVIPVVGLPGLGKTTLAIKIYEDPKISYKFYKRIWVYIGQKYKLDEVFLKILGEYTKTNTQEYQSMAVKELRKKISEFIAKGGKCLIVLDDVWAPEVVDSVMKVFPENSKGHRIMITTREDRIGRYANANPHLLKFLTDDESFQLLENRVFRGHIRRCSDELVPHGTSIAKKCSGVPLAVVVIAGALKGKTDPSEWKIVEDNVGEHLIDPQKPNSCLKFVETSYDHLPEDMKACFLYCGAFPPGFEIPAWKLIRLWISEGLVNSKLKASPENIAEQYLNDLVNRNLVMVMRKRADGQVKTCRLHDMLHQFCKVEAKNGGLFQEVCEKTDQSGLDIPNLDYSHRLCVQHSLLKDFISREPSVHEHVRSFLCFSMEQKGSMQLSNIKYLQKSFPLIRVLDVDSLKFTFGKYFLDRYHLRYIAISGDFKALPKFFGTFWNLQTLILTTEQSTIEIQADIWNMLRLRHLHTNAPAKLLCPGTLTENQPSCLQTLSKVTTGSFKEGVLERACNLRKVGIQGPMAEFFKTGKCEFNNFKKIKCLEKLKLVNDIGSSMNTGFQLPPGFFEFLRQLKKLTLSKTRLAWTDANELGKLECLEVLKLKEYAFVGTTWDSKGFSQLKVLWIERADFETWKVSTHSFQRLKNLVLKSCEKLKAVPTELASVSSLQEMTLENTEKANQSAKAIKLKKKDIPKFTLTIFPPEKAD